VTGPFAFFDACEDVLTGWIAGKTITSRIAKSDSAIGVADRLVDDIALHVSQSGDIAKNLRDGEGV
jgi:hypothetical protein